MKIQKSKGGTLFLVIGNSGAGKDSLIQWVLQAWPAKKMPPYVPTRIITRPPSPETEGFESVSDEKFQQMAAAGGFSLQWQSYGDYYGVPKEIETELMKGHSVLVNVSRQIVDDTRKRFPKVKVIFVQVPFTITEERVRARGREKEAHLEERIDRARENPEFPDADFVIDNSGNINIAGKCFLDILMKYS